MTYLSSAMISGEVLGMISRSIFLAFVCTSVFAKTIYATNKLDNHETQTQLKLVLFGGGREPVKAVDKMLNWAGGNTGRILVFEWGVPRDNHKSFEAIRQDYTKQFPHIQTDLAPILPLTPETHSKLLAQIAWATGVFFSGGDQRLIMEGFDANSDVLEAVENSYKQGVLYSGTSAGTAIMSRIMYKGGGNLGKIQRDEFNVRRGAGLLPPNVIVDQHFFVRLRFARLISWILGQPDFIGLGINEGAAVALTNNNCGEVYGTGSVLMTSPDNRHSNMVFLQEGDHFNFANKDLVSVCE